MESVELYRPKNSALNRIGRFFFRIPIRNIDGVNSANINRKRNSMIKKYKLIEDENNKEKYFKSYNLYIEAINDYIMNKIYKRVKLEVATEYEKNILSEYYYILKLKEEYYDEYKCRKQIYLMNLDFENIKSDENIFQKFKEVYKYNINKLYGKLIILKREKQNSYETVNKVIEEYNNDLYVRFILLEKSIEPYIEEEKETANENEISEKNIQKFKTFINIAEGIFKEETNENYINYLNGLIDEENKKIKINSKKKVRLQSLKKSYIRKKEREKNEK